MYINWKIAEIEMKQSAGEHMFKCGVDKSAAWEELYRIGRKMRIECDKQPRRILKKK